MLWLTGRLVWISLLGGAVNVCFMTLKVPIIEDLAFSLSICNSPPYDFFFTALNPYVDS